MLEQPKALKKLCTAISKFSNNYKLVIAPGGSRFADLVRDVDSRFHLSPAAAHKMAILAVDQYGLLLSHFIPNSNVTYNPSEAVKAENNPAIFLPSRIMFQENLLKASWNVTSDSIAAYVAHVTEAEKLVLVKDVDGIFNKDPKINPTAALIRVISAEKLKKARYGCVDSYLPGLLLKLKRACYVVNGCFPNRILNILKDKPDIYSKITV